MNDLFAYVKYSQAEFSMSWQYLGLFVFTNFLWVFLWLGYKNNKKYDEIREKEKSDRIAKKKDRQQKLSKLYPKS